MSNKQSKQKRIFRYQRRSDSSSTGYCCVPQCSNSGRYNSFLSFHRFPANEKERAVWLAKIRRDAFVVSKTTNVCSRHFEDDVFSVTATGVRRLNKGAVPTRFAWNNYSRPAPRPAASTGLDVCPALPLEEPLPCEEEVMEEIGSVYNHRIERMWPEINNRVNFPIKAALVNLTDQEQINMDDNTVKFCVSNLTCQVTRLGINRVVEAWNAHRIPGKGVPNSLGQGGCVKKITEDLLPCASAAADLYEAESGSSLTRWSTFGNNPFSNEEEQAQAERRFAERFPDIAVLYESVVNHNPRPLQEAIMYLIHV